MSKKRTHFTRRKVKPVGDDIQTIWSLNCVEGCYTTMTISRRNGETLTVDMNPAIRSVRAIGNKQGLKGMWSFSVLPLGDIERLRDRVQSGNVAFECIKDDGSGHQGITIEEIEHRFGACPARDPTRAYREKTMRYNASTTPLTFSLLSSSDTGASTGAFTVDSSGAAATSTTTNDTGSRSGEVQDVVPENSQNVGTQDPDQNDCVLALLQSIHNRADDLKQLGLGFGFGLGSWQGQGPATPEQRNTIWKTASSIHKAVDELQVLLTIKSGNRPGQGNRFSWDPLHLLDAVLMSDTLREPVSRYSVFLEH